VGRTISLGVLEQVRIASPCSMRWEDMAPVEGDRVRHCGACDLNVYNLSGMSRGEAEALVRARAATGERLCAQLLVRADGTVLTRDCPVGLRAARLRIARAFSRLAAAAALFLTGAVAARLRENGGVSGLARVQPFATLCEWIRPPKPQILVPPQFIRGEAILGKMMCPAPAAPQTGASR
jgi:hypothetical protein